MTPDAGAVPDRSPSPTAADTRDRPVNPELEDLESLAHKMDTLFRIPGTSIRVGLDTILGLIPGIGDTATMLPAGYIIYRAHRMGAPRSLLTRMGVNAGIDWVIGSIPLVGDLFDLGFKANRRNVALLRRHLERANPKTARPTQGKTS